MLLNKRQYECRYPYQYEREYKKQLVNLVKILKKSVVLELDNIKTFINQNRLDSLSDTFNDVMDKIKQNYYVLIAKDFITRKIEQMFLNISRFTKNELDKSFKSKIDVDIFTGEPNLQELMNLWVDDNVNLITSVETQFFDKVKQIILEAIQNGMLTKNLANSIKMITGTTEKRAILIAVDQIGKLNGQITRMRQVKAGIKEYIWRTAGDSRVRPMHKARNGKKYRWDKPPIDGHPGMAIRCRCVAIPVIDLNNINGVAIT